MTVTEWWAAVDELRRAQSIVEGWTDVRALRQYRQAMARVRWLIRVARRHDLRMPVRLYGPLTPKSRRVMMMRVHAHLLRRLGAGLIELRARLFRAGKP